jgi:protein ImuB
MPRVVSLYLPTWPTDRLRRNPAAGAPPSEMPLVLVGRDGGRRVILAADQAARAAGLHVGMAATQAQALVSGLVIQNADPAADRAALDRLALWGLRHYAPIIAADPPDGLVIDTTGADHLHGGEEAMLSAIVERLKTSGIACRAAIADSWGAAHAFARYQGKPTIIIPPGKCVEQLVHLPIAALRLAVGTVDALRVLGFERIGELAAQPRAPVALRFGPEVGRRIDQAMGKLAEPIVPVHEQNPIEVRRAFAEPIGAAETIARYVGKLAEELSEALETRGVGAKRLDLLFHRVDSRVEAIRVGTALPVRDPMRLTRLLCDKIETVDPGFGIELMVLTASLVGPIAPRQVISSLAGEPESDVSELVDTLANRIGAERLYRIAPVASDVPERSITRVAPLAPKTAAGWPEHWPRPSRLLRKPEGIEAVALLPDHPPAAFTWRGIRRRVRRGDGPERVFGEWWKRDAELASVRDYFQVEDDAGERFWLFRAGDGADAATGSHRWFMHGIFG